MRVRPETIVCIGIMATHMACAQLLSGRTVVLDGKWGSPGDDNGKFAFRGISVQTGVLEGKFSYMEEKEGKTYMFKIAVEQIPPKKGTFKINELPFLGEISVEMEDGPRVKLGTFNKTYRMV